MELMEVALEQAEVENPIKATVESVLPGVQLQFTNLHKEVMGCKRVLDDLYDAPKVTTVLPITGTLDDCCVFFFLFIYSLYFFLEYFLAPQMQVIMSEYSVESAKSMKLALATQFASIAYGLVAEEGIMISPPATKKIAAAAAAVTPPEQQEEPQPLSQDDPPDFVVCPPMKTRVEPYSVTAIYYEYYGIQIYENEPIPGRFKAMEELYGTKWRRGDMAYQKAFSRMQQIVAAVELWAKEEEASIGEALTHFDVLFDGKKCKSVAKFVDILQNMGYLAKRQRKASSP